ncbi:MraY family glycosyltransferase [Algoriphagus taiwanensis]|uniref:MraY family glycosyltransferase n=2 Tax=Algoriphagus taiwanensis TaxID=1445656 RepID=A0ABQ6Q622_9BACT|nr:MraY family glycosyltransferase [Algoriphagus taiwanensis]
MGYLLLSFLTAFSTGILFYPALIKILKSLDLSEKPGGRKIHKKTTPSMGGIGFFLATSISLGIWGWQYPLPDIRYLLGAIALMFFVGFRDDLVELKAKHKILGQLVAVILVVVAGDIRVRDFHGFMGIGELPIWFSYGFTAFVLLALTNAFNLIDGLDGLAATVALITLGLLGSWFYFQGLESYSVLCFTLLGGVLSFLVFNWHPAKIFMGDTGSLTLGFAMGSLVVAFMDYNSALPEGALLKFGPSFTMGIVLLIYPLYDMARVFTRRIRRGQHPMTADKSHVHHFLMRMGLSHDKVALILGGTQILLITLVLGMSDLSDNLALPVLSAVVLFMGYRLDKITPKYIKKKVNGSLKTDQKSAMKSTKKDKVKLEKSIVEPEKINLN